MKYFLMVLILALTGCQTAGALLQGAGQGMQQNKTVQCTTNQLGNTYYSNCR